MRCGIVLALFMFCPGIGVADVWEFRSDGTSVFHQQPAKVERIRVAPRVGVKGSTMAKRRAMYDPLIQRISREEGVDSRLVHAMIQVESAYDPNALSVKGAVGLMQLMPGTAYRFGVKDSSNPEENIRGGVRYIRFLDDLIEGPVEFVIAAYHAGENRVVPCKKSKGAALADCERLTPRIPNISSTRKHILKVMRALHTHVS